MDDLIKRQDAIDAICQQAKYASGDMAYVDAIRHLPSAQKTGKWIPWKAYYGEDRKSWSDELKCSECGYKWGDEEYRFCPNCGAKMMEE